MAISKVKLPDNSVQDIMDSRITGVDSSPTSGSSNVVTSGGAYNEIHPAIATTQPSGGFLPNVLYNLGTLTGSKTFSLAMPSSNTIVNHYYWTFTAGSTAPTITWPSGLTWVGTSAPAIEAGGHYEISVLNGIAAYLEA